ncbi:ParB N-terminal domain-containing protein [Monoglobus pectinilyticus]|uniref:ParB domain protein nuclease n=1 Tax=Monoglobus pectinilyticus TaxID=1981510 RepID=A0A2K9P3S9_9FIRM|nr:ParB N-terminal domain-containing protein [Monoglobus pectinilyticus]AUO19913.1 ParB domain protein nuclease [Monoglobus pectinilyticus]
MEIIYKSTKEIKPYENNPRNNNEAVEKVAVSITDYGFRVPIIIDSNNVIVAGHTRYKAALKIGCESVPCIVIDDLTPEQIRAYRLVDNKTAEYSSWDFEMLEKELKSLDIDISEFEFPDLGETLDISDDDFYTDETVKNVKVKSIKCPHCGEIFEL